MGLSIIHALILSQNDHVNKGSSRWYVDSSSDFAKPQRRDIFCKYVFFFVVKFVRRQDHYIGMFHFETFQG